MPHTHHCCAVFWLTLCLTWAPLTQAQTDANGEAYAKRGLELARTGELQGAETALRRAIELSPKQASYCAELGAVLGLQGKLREAEAYFQRAVQLDPESLKFRRELAAVLWQLGNLQQAENNLDFILQKQPGDRATILLLGLLSESKQDFARAAFLLGSVPELVLQQPERIVALAHSYYATGQPTEARNLLRQLLEKSAVPASTNAILAGARTAAEARDYRTVEQFAEALPDNYRAWMLKGTVELRLNHFIQATASYSRAVDLNRKEPDALLGLATAQSLAGMKEPALQNYQKGIQEFSGDARFYHAYAATLVNLGEAGTATGKLRVEHLLRKAIALDASFAAAHFLLGQLALDNARLTEALSELQIVAKLDSKSSRVHFALERVYRRLGQIQSASNELAIFQKLKEEEEKSVRISAPAGMDK